MWQGSWTNMADTLFEPFSSATSGVTETGTTETSGMSGSSSPASR